MATETAWCPTCRTSREVMDEYATDTGDGRTPRVTYVARPLECGHDAGDGGAVPSTRQPTQDPVLMDRVVALQQHANGR